MRTKRRIEARGRSGIAAALPRVFAMLLVVVFLLPTMAQAQTAGSDSHPFAHAFEVVAADDVGANQAQGGCCLECPQHAWYRHAEVEDSSTVLHRIARDLRYALSDETARSSDVDPPSEPPKA